MREAEEPFRAGQKGSSAMPHKRNPIVSERITGLARLLRGYAQAGLENVALWHERDISHSSAERVILPDATILLDYMQHPRAARRRGDGRPQERMLANLELTHGALFSQRALLALVEQGGLRATTPTASSRRTRSAPGTRGIPLRDLLARGRPAGLDLDAIFDPAAFVRHAAEIVGRLDEIA